LSVAWLVFFNAALLVPTMLLLPLLVFAAIWAAGGHRLARRAAFPVFYLYFALPVWDAIDAPLQSLTTDASLGLLSLTGIPVLAEGNVIHIPEGAFEIATSCNGLHFVIVALAIATVHGYVEGYDRRSRVMLLLIATALAIATNLVRIFCVIVAGHLTDMQHFLVRVDHYYFGWVLFAISLLLYVFASSRIPLLRHEAAPTTPRASGATGSYAPIALVLAAAALAVGPLWSLAAITATVDSPATSPPRLASWTGPTPSSWAWQPVYANADERFVESYRNERAGEVSLFRAAYHYQRQGREVRGYGNSLAGPGYSIRSSKPAAATIEGQSLTAVEHLVVADSGQELLVWSFHGVGDRLETPGVAGQIRYGVNSLFEPLTASVIAVAAECRTDCDSARRTVEEFSALALPVLLPGLPATDEP
jgi:EpsI family protein